MRYRITSSINTLPTYHQALTVARRNVAGPGDVEQVIEIDAEGNETPIAVVMWRKPTKQIKGH